MGIMNNKTNLDLLSLVGPTWGARPMVSDKFEFGFHDNLLRLRVNDYKTLKTNDLIL
jgi:hypothetical protein